MNSKIVLGAGAMKAGTTFLFNILSKHPDLFFTPEKEVHFLAHMHGLDYGAMSAIRKQEALLARDYFARPLGEVLSMDYRRERLAAVMRGRFRRLTDAQDVRDIVLWYADKYLEPVVDWSWVEGIYQAAQPHQWLCEFSNYNAFASHAAWADLQNHFVDIKVIYIVRNPLDRLWSHIKFDRRYGPDDFGDLTSETLSKYLSEPHICAYGDYKTVLKKLFAEIGSENVLVIDFEHLTERPLQICREIETFLDIEEFPSSALRNLKPANVGAGQAMPPFLIEASRDFVEEQAGFLASLMQGYDGADARL